MAGLLAGDWTEGEEGNRGGASAFVLVVGKLKTAKTLGLTIPPSVLARADVIWFAEAAPWTFHRSRDITSRCGPSSLGFLSGNQDTFHPTWPNVKQGRTCRFSWIWLALVGAISGRDYPHNPTFIADEGM